MVRFDDLPVEIQAKMIEYAREANPTKTVFEIRESFRRDIEQGTGTGGFNWRKAPEGDNFWHEVLVKEKIDLFFEKYPRTPKREEELFTYGLESIKYLFTFPEEIRKLIEERTEEYQRKIGNNHCNQIDIVSMFQYHLTEEGVNFWYKIQGRKYDVFYEMYGDKKETITYSGKINNTSIKTIEKEDKDIPYKKESKRKQYDVLPMLNIN